MEETEVEDLRPLLRYITVLIDEYPDPISQTELAMKGSVTKSAVSKIVDRLKPFCSMRMLAFERKLVLETNNDTFLQLFWLFLSEMDFQKFLQSNYARSFIKALGIHDRLAKIENLEYGKYFDEFDTELMIRILLSNICSYQIRGDLQDRFKTMFEVDQEDSFLAVFPVIHIINEISSNFNLGFFENEHELHDIVMLRDKFFAFIRSFAGRIISEWEVITRIQDSGKKETYFNAYMEAVDHFLISELSKVTERIKKAAAEKGLPFRKSYDKIGQLYPK